MCFIDATNAFYGVNHVKMFTKMVERGVHSEGAGILVC